MNDDRERVADLAGNIEDLFNTFGSDTYAKMLASHFLNCHRTIQQSIVRGMFIILREIAKQEYYDARNEQAVKAARVAVEAVDNEHIGLPLI